MVGYVMILYDSTNWKHTKIKEQWTKTDTWGIPDLIFICADLQLLIENENVKPKGLRFSFSESQSRTWPIKPTES